MFSLRKIISHHKGRVIEKWIFDAKSPLLSGAAISDIDNDGHPEVIFGTKEGSIHCVDSQAKERWVFKTGEDKLSKGDEFFYDLEKLHAISNQPTVADINNDGQKEIIFGSDDGTIYALKNNGELLWKYTIGGSIRSTPKVLDINNDGAIEIIATSTAKKLVVLTSSGKPVVSYKTIAACESTPGVFCGEKGCQSVIIFGLNDGSINAINTNEEHLWSFQTNDKVTAEPMFVKTKNETLVIVGSWDNAIYALTLKGELRWKYKTEGAIYNKVAIGDVNKDGKAEIVFGSCDNSVYALTLEGERLWSYQTNFWIVAPPLLHDIDNDGNIEVIIGSFDANVYVLEGAGSYELDYVPGLSGIIHQVGHYADVLSSEPGERQGKSVWQYKTQGMIVGCSMLENQLIVNVKSGFVDTLSHKT